MESKCNTLHAEKVMTTQSCLRMAVLGNECTAETVASCFLVSFILSYKIKGNGLLQLAFGWHHPGWYLFKILSVFSTLDVMH